MSARSDFIQLLDNQPCTENADVIVVLRSRTPTTLAPRFERGVQLLNVGFTPLLVVPNATNTRTEAEFIFRVAADLMWKRIIIVTHRQHHYRAYLTFLKVFQGFGVEIVSAPIHTEQRITVQEIEKIEEYQTKGDVASYEEGIASLANHQA